MILSLVVVASFALSKMELFDCLATGSVAEQQTCVDNWKQKGQSQNVTREGVTKRATPKGDKPATPKATTEPNAPR